MAAPLIAAATAILTTAVAFGAATVLYSRWKTRALKLYLLFVATIVLFTTAMGLLTLADIIGMPGLRNVSFVLQAIGGVVHVAVLPHFIYTISNRYPSRYVRVIFGTLSGIMAILGGTFIVRPSLHWIAYVLSTILYSTVAWALIQTGWWQRRDRVQSDSELRTFLWVSAAFLPLFVMDVLVTTLQWGAPWRYLDGLPLPVYLILLTVGSLVFALRRFNMPALYADVMEGYSVPDLASVLKISPRTAEHHLYRVYNKLAVSNRIQLYQTLMAHRQE